MRNLLLLSLVMLAWAGTAPFTHAQQSEPNPTVPADAARDAEAVPAELAGLTKEELIAQAYAAIELAEARGPDAQTALARANELVAAIRGRDAVNPHGDFIAGRASLLLGRPRDAIGLIDSFAKSREGENDWLAFKLLGDLYVSSKYYEGARDKFQRAIDLNPREPGPYAGMARTWAGLGRPGKAVQFAQEAIARDNPPDPADRDPKYYAALAQALSEDHRPEEAADAASSALEIARTKARNDPTNPTQLSQLDAHNALLEGIVGTLVSRFPERTAEHLRLARVRRERAEIAHLLALHRILRFLEEGIARSEPNVPPELRLEQARLLIEVGVGPKAVEVLTALLAQDPSHAEARQLLERVQVPQQVQAPRQEPPAP